MGKTFQVQAHNGLYCQVESLSNKALGMLVRDYLEYMNRHGKTHCNYEWPYSVVWSSALTKEQMAECEHLSPLAS